MSHVCGTKWQIVSEPLAVNVFESAAAAPVKYPGRSKLPVTGSTVPTLFVDGGESQVIDVSVVPLCTRT